MAILKLAPVSCADSFYALGGDAPKSMALLQNLIPAPDTKDHWIPRPAATKFTGSDTFTPGFVSCQLLIGTRLYGMVSSALNAGKDQPFCYDLLGGAFITISGITSGNVPTSPPATGGWTPPHMELVGVKIVVTHTGFSGAGSNFFGLIDISNPSSLTWTTANTATNALPSVPVWVTNFYQRAYFFCNPTNAQPSVIASDVLVPATRTNATYILTFGDNVPLLCGGVLGFDNQLGGQISALIIFKSNGAGMFQVTGDFALTGSQAIAQAQMNVPTGTLAPNSVVGTPQGLAFVAPDGLRMVDFQGHVSDPIGFGGTGVSTPFINAVVPSRIAAACNATTVRISTQNGGVAGAPQQDWCFDFARKIWYGPHTFPISLISSYNNSFVVSAPAIKGFWQSDIVPTSTSTYTENGASYQCVYQSAFFPERDDLNELSMTRGVFYQTYGVGTTVYNVSALDENGNPLGFTTASFSSTGAVWGTAVWGSGALLGSSQAMAATNIPWPNPVVFDRMAMQISFTAVGGTRLGNVILELNVEGETVTP